jgi:hypothetical protein
MIALPAAAVPPSPPPPPPGKRPLSSHYSAGAPRNPRSKVRRQGLPHPGRLSLGGAGEDRMSIKPWDLLDTLGFSDEGCAKRLREIRSPGQ